MKHPRPPKAGARASTTRKVPSAVSSTLTVKEVLWGALEALDAIAQDAHVQSQKVAYQQEGGMRSSRRAQHTSTHKRGRTGDDEGEAEAPQRPTASAHAGDVFAAMSQPHYHTLCTAIASYGLQLLPSLDEIVRRVGLAVATPILASVESWETAAMLCSYYRAGAARLLEELVEVLLRVPGVFLLGASCVVPPTVMEQVVMVGEGSVMTHMDKNGDVYARLPLVVTKLKALREMFMAAGPHIPLSMLQTVAARFAHEVVEKGILAETPFTEGATTVDGVFAGPPSGNHPSESDPVDMTCILRWRVPVEWQAPCIDILHTLIAVCRPVPAQVSAVAMRLVQEVTASLHRGIQVISPVAATSDKTMTVGSGSLPNFCGCKDIITATTQLSQLLHVLHHPSAVPIFIPSSAMLEQVKRKILIADTVTLPQSETHSVADTYAGGVVPHVRPSPSIVCQESCSTGPETVKEGTKEEVIQTCFPTTVVPPSSGVTDSAPAKPSPLLHPRDAPVPPVLDGDEEIPEIDMDD